MSVYIPRDPNLSRRFYTSVDASTVVKDDYVPANGEVLEIVKLGGNSAYDMHIHVEIIWDADTVNARMLMSTHGDFLQDDVIGEVLTGDGVKKLQIKLSNHTLGDGHPIGAFWEAIKR
jgi:hypothetical protein